MNVRAVVLLICFYGVIAGPPGPLITLSSQSNVYSLGWLGTTENSIGYQFLMNITSTVQVANSGHILTIRNDTAVLFPSYISGNTQIYACSWKNLRCSAGPIIPSFSFNSMSFDESNSQLWFVGLSGNQYEVGRVVISSFDQPITVVPLIYTSFGNATSATNIQGTLGALQYYVSYTLDGVNYAVNVNRSTSQVTQTTFQNGFAPVSMIYNANSLTNLTSLYEASANSYKTCSPDFPKGNAEYPLNATPFPNAAPTPLVAAEFGGFSNYYYSVLRSNLDQNLYVWVVNAADGWTISNNTIASTPLASSSIWGIATTQPLNP